MKVVKFKMKTVVKNVWKILRKYKKMDGFFVQEQKLKFLKIMKPNIKFRIKLLVYNVK